MDLAICNFNSVRERLELQLLAIKRIVRQLLCVPDVNETLFAEFYEFDAINHNYLTLLYRLNNMPPNIILSLPMGYYFKSIINEELKATTNLIKRIFIYGSHTLLTNHEHEYLKKYVFPGMLECSCQQCLNEIRN
mgnify:FL=1|tara:strand:+ start:192 stop:596 length:405 start_codon:yes stop_codon:yes gene_type:complete